MPEKIAILGAGESGTGTALLAAMQGYRVWVSDQGTLRDRYRKMLIENDIPFEEGKHTSGKILDADLVMKSPGIPDSAEIVQKIRAKGIPVVSEIEFAARFTDATLIGITGSNGKTTTTCLTWHILNKAGLNVALAGNVGRSFAGLVAEKACDYYVIELSSFQLDDTFHFRPHLAVIMNITPDHLDRYGYNMQHYIDSKFRIIRNQSSSDHLIYCLDDPVIRKELETRKPNMQMHPFSVRERLENGAWLDEDILRISNLNQSFDMTIHDLALMGQHNVYNSMAAGIAAQILNIRKETIRESLSDFQGVEHRLEKVISVHGIEFINDSKATNVNSTWYALESISTPVVWITGGVDKGNDYAPLKDLVKEKVRAIVCLGKDNSSIHRAFEGLVPTIVDTSSMQEAVQAAYYLAHKEETVLLSPACASFDLFENYEDRGRQFKQAVRNL
ncbi:MAG TPA: UDP-N-acetylmuramoyl-L-alanine--D-glutamate ligase [Bacteroidetes bacterium]|nr:UDP-N-acetylmuramoyl-L-alanine--D-glutamate ligase [Bacteroidota bacterium]